MIIDLKNVERSYTRGGETLHVLQGIDLQMETGEFYALMGPSGSGKTTLLNLIGGLDQADEGQVVVAGSDLTRMEGSVLSRWRSENVGFVPPWWL